jgi:hypothetical protein
LKLKLQTTYKDENKGGHHIKIEKLFVIVSAFEVAMWHNESCFAGWKEG